MGLNKTMVIGNVGITPRKNEGSCYFRLATNSVDKQKRKYTQWYDCVAFGKTADIILEYVKTGSRLYVEGSMRSSEYKGNDRWNLIVKNVEFLDKRKEEAAA
jgi:single-strand DNA-binding protein